jgi:hypothetical protein
MGRINCELNGVVDWVKCKVYGKKIEVKKIVIFKVK